MNPIAVLLARSLAPTTLNVLCDDDQDGFPDASILQQLTADAQAEIDAATTRLRDDQRLDIVRDILTDLLITLVIERLFLRRRELDPGAWVERAERARALLRTIADGTHPLLKIPIPLASSSDARPLDNPPFRKFGADR